MSKKNVMPSSKFKTPAQQLIEQQIALNGPMNFAEFVDLALYHPTYGYYNRKAPQRGKMGDYFTSLQVSSLFPSILAEALIQMKEELGTEQFHVIEYGSGSGELMEGICRALTAKKLIKGFQFWAIERSRPARDILWKKLSRFPKTRVLSTFEEGEWNGGLDGCILSNEFFDALSFRRLVFRSQTWKEIFIDLNENGLHEVEKDLSFPEPVSLKSEKLSFAEGQQIEVRLGLNDFFEEWNQFLTRGYILTFDYGYPRQDLYSERRMKGTWQAFFKHKANDDAFHQIGNQDLTAHIDFNQLYKVGKENSLDPALFCSQGMFLSVIGKDLIQKALDQTPEEEKPKLIRALQQLVHPDAMGEKFWVFLQKKEVGMPTSFSDISNRLRRLELIQA